MPRGQPDFGAYAAKEVTASVSDLGELGVRLGAIDAYDKRGDVVYFDDFEEPILKWEITDADGAVYLHSLDAKSGSQSVALSTDAGAGKNVWIKKNLAIAPSRRLGLEFSFGSTLTGLLYMLPAYHDGTLDWRPSVKMDFDTRKLYVWDRDLGDYTLVADIPQFWFGTGWHFFYTLKVVFDIGTGKFVRIMFADREWDISTIPIRSIAPGVVPHLEVDIGRENVAAPARITSIDDFIFTQAEP